VGEWFDGWIDGWINGCLDGWMDGRMKGWGKFKLLCRLLAGNSINLQLNFR
jgi:hypothetical protein